MLSLISSGKWTQMHTGSVMYDRRAINFVINFNLKCCEVTKSYPSIFLTRKMHAWVDSWASPTSNDLEIKTPQSTVGRSLSISPRLPQCSRMRASTVWLIKFILISWFLLASLLVWSRSMTNVQCQYAAAAYPEWIIIMVVSVSFLPSRNQSYALSS
jgi:hypothetical protein